MNFGVALIIGSILGLVATIVLYIKVLPRKLDGTFNNRFLQFLHNYFHFKKLYIEEILKFIFTLASVSCVLNGVMLMFSVSRSYNWYTGRYTTQSNFLAGLLLLVLGPVALRLTYEGLMMAILLVKNVMDINNKLKAPAEQTAQAPVVTQPYCHECGTKLNRGVMF